MARKIAVIHKESVQTYVKKSVAAMLVRRLLAEWVSENISIRRLKVNSARLPGTLKQSCTSKRIPERLPSHKTPGTKTVGPVVERSRERRQLIQAAKHPQMWNPIERSGVSAINPIL